MTLPGFASQEALPLMQPHSIKNNDDRKQENHEWQFGDVTIPARLFYLLRDGELSIADLLLITVVGKLVKPHGTYGGEEGVGCWASNAYLAKVTRSYPTHVSERISHLKRKGILVVLSMNGQRYLELEWSRTAEEREAMTHDYGVVLRQAHAKLLKPNPPFGSSRTPPSAQAEPI